jgi:hypothetical protein
MNCKCGVELLNTAVCECDECDLVSRWRAAHVSWTKHGGDFATFLRVGREQREG